LQNQQHKDDHRIALPSAKEICFVRTKDIESFPLNRSDCNYKTIVSFNSEK